MAKSEGIRHRLLTILLLGVLVSALTLAALVHLLTTTTRQRVERAREAVTEELDRLAKDPRELGEPAPRSIVGMRGGTSKPGSIPNGLPSAWQNAFAAADRTAATRGATASVDLPLADSTLVLGVRSTGSGQSAWAGFLVRPLPSLRTWQWIVTLLAMATAVLVATTIYSVVTVHRGASALRGALEALAKDLSAPIPRPNIRELSLVADGVADLALGLARARREEERLERELAQRERLAALGRVAAGVAHEVRNPLASIKLRLDLAASASPLSPELEKAISHATTEIGRLDRLVADLLIVAGRSPGPKYVLSLGSLVRARIDALAPWAAERSVAMTAEGDETCEADLDSLARALDNLLRNAVEASKAGTEVRVEVTRRGDHAVVAVLDHGQGAPAEHALQLFEPFFTTKRDGTGLGLALSRAIARTHGGDVTYTREGATTRFDLVIPTALAGERAAGGDNPKKSATRVARADNLVL